MGSLVIAINYKTDEHAAQLARSLARYRNQDVSVVLVDNSERGDAEVFSDLIHSANPNVRCVQAPTNLGYFGGANFGLKQYLADFPWPEWVIICNVDIEFNDPTFFSALGQLNGPDPAGVVAPRIWSARFQRDLNPKIKLRPTRQRMLFYKAVFGNYYSQMAYEILSFLKYTLQAQVRGARALILGQRADEAPNDTSTSIYAAHGSCMIFNRRYFVSGGSIEYPVFLFGEEIFVAETARRLGLSVAYCPQLWVLDKQHASARAVIRSRRVAGYMNDATRYLVQKYFA